MLSVSSSIVNALVGGAFIGIAVSLMLFLNGRVTGISGIVNSILNPSEGDRSWRISFVIGLFVSGLILKFSLPSALEGTLDTELSIVSLAGLLVGFGTVLGSGCTSGHGVCGISRLSKRSFVATTVFIVAGIFSVVIFRKLGVFP